MHILVTGANGGFGTLIVAKLLEAGHTVTGSMRDPHGRNAATTEALTALGAKIVDIDVTDDGSVIQGVETAVAQSGQIDVLINNAGVGAHGLLENFTDGDFQQVFDINVFGVQRMTRAVLPAMRARKSGLIVNVSTLLARLALPFFGPYNAAKWALEALSETYRVELSEFGIDVAIIEPGGFPTAFFNNQITPSSHDRVESYGEFAQAPRIAQERFSGFLQSNPQQDPQLVADAIVKVVDQKPGSRRLRTEVDTVGMGEAIVAYNDHHDQVTAGIFKAFGMEQMLELKSRPNTTG